MITDSRYVVFDAPAGLWLPYDGDEAGGYCKKKKK